MLNKSINESFHKHALGLPLPMFFFVSWRPPSILWSFLLSHHMTPCPPDPLPVLAVTSSLMFSSSNPPWAHCQSLPKAELCSFSFPVLSLGQLHDPLSGHSKPSSREATWCNRKHELWSLSELRSRCFSATRSDPQFPHL